MIGRGEFIRLMFEVAGVEYVERGQPAEGEVQVGGGVYTNPVFEFVYGSGNSAGYPVFAPPVIRKGAFVLSQTGVIMRYLGRKFDMNPEGEEDEFHAEQVMALITDFIADGRLAFHGANFNASYYTQIAETQPYIERFVTTRLPKYLAHLNKVLAFNTLGHHLFVVGTRLTYVDVGLLHVLMAAQSQFPDTFKDDFLSANYPFLAAFLASMLALPRVAQYLASPRRGSFEGNSMM